MKNDKSFPKIKKLTKNKLKENKKVVIDFK